MSFWGVEVKPGKPYTHIHDNLRGSLRLSQVTLGDGQGSKRSVLQCNVGDRSPVLLCSLLPDKAECCGMNLHFEECYEVVFSVVGPRSVHLAGYFVDVASKRRPFDGEDSESFGEDIAETGSEASGSHASQDTYESDFIDDGDLEMPSSPRRAKASVRQKKPTSEAAGLKRKHRISDSDEGDDEPKPQIITKPKKHPVSDSEDDDFFPISLSLNKKSEAKNLNGSQLPKAAAKVTRNEFDGEDKADPITTEKPKKRKKNQRSPEKEIKSRSSDYQNESEKGKQDGKDDLNHGAVSRLDKNASKADKKSKSKEVKEELSKKGVEHLTDHGAEKTKSDRSVALEVEPAESSKKSRKKKKQLNADLDEKANTEKNEEASSGRGQDLSDKQDMQGEAVAPSVEPPKVENHHKLKKRKDRRKEKEDIPKDVKTGDDLSNNEVIHSIETPMPDADKGSVNEKSKRKKKSLQVN